MESSADSLIGMTLQDDTGQHDDDLHDTHATLRRTVEQCFTAAGGAPSDMPPLTVGGPRHALPTPYDVTGLAVGSIGAALAAIAELRAARTGRQAPAVHLHTSAAAVAFRCERHTEPLGWTLPPVWDPIAGDYRCADGFIRLHTNYRHHRGAALRALQLRDTGQLGRQDVARTVAHWDGEALESAVVEAGGCAAYMRTAAAWAAHPQGRAVADEPLVRRHATPAPRPRWAARPAEPLPLSGIRVLDMTRVIAGPVGTRLLAGYGAEVLRLDPPGFEEVGSLLVETTAGKRCAALDLQTAAGRVRFSQLLGAADMLVHGYRHGALRALGFDTERLRREHPHLVVTQHDAYGFAGPWRHRRGFDSLVQMSCGIAEYGMRTHDADHPRPLPAQALDHATGYLIAAATCRALTEHLLRSEATYSWLSLARTAQVLLDGGPGDPHAAAPEAPTIDASLEHADTAWGAVRRARLPGQIAGLRPALDEPAGRLGAQRPCFA